jgi:hypothetical protein
VALCKPEVAGSNPGTLHSALPSADDSGVKEGPPRTRLLVLPALLLASFVGTGISACLQTEEGRRATLRDRAAEIVPTTARIRSLGYGDCVELAPTPSCARVVFELSERDSARRAALVRRTAEEHGWEVTRSDDAEGGWSLFLKRKGFTAFVVLWRPEKYPQADCHGKEARDDVCFNTLNLTRD